MIPLILLILAIPFAFFSGFKTGEMHQLEKSFRRRKH